MSRPRISSSLRRQIANDANDRCGYCLGEETFMGVSLTIDHLIPLALGGSNRRENLWLACRQCNELKHTWTHAEDPETGEIVALFNPRTQVWSQHFQMDEDAVIIALTPVGRATLQALQLNRTILVSARRRWLFVGWQPFGARD
jgi:hypothetical protein